LPTPGLDAASLASQRGLNAHPLTDPVAINTVADLINRRDVFVTEDRRKTGERLEDCGGVLPKGN
jgi:hypothetical protein